MLKIKTGLAITILGLLGLCIGVKPIYAANTQSFSTECGNVKFRVDVLNNGFAFDNSYSLFADTALGAVELYKGQDWFFAACLNTKSAKPLLVFQNYCSGSACNEKNYGAVDPANLAVVLKPSLEKPENYQDISSLLGMQAPNLSESDAAFCCAEKPAKPQLKPQQALSVPVNTRADVRMVAFGLLLVIVIGLVLYKRKKGRISN